MSNPSSILEYYTPPTLSYIGAVDITASQYGTTMYSVFYDAAISTLGNVLMFEYKLIKQTTIVPTPATVTFGFVSIENAVNAGISNQWTIAIPATNEEYDPTAIVKISSRVYVGLTGSAEVGVTEWSNELDVHNPPPEPFIVAAFYDTPSVIPGPKDDLFVFLQNDINYNDDINFVVAYYYQDISNNTVWDVTSPLSPIEVESSDIDPSFNKFLMIQVPEFGKVSQTDDVVYVAVYAVFRFQDPSLNNYYTVSHISNTFSAEPTTYFNKPTIYRIDYDVYTTSFPVPGSQIMTVKWAAPPDSIIPAYNVSYYNVYSTTQTDSSNIPINWGLDASVNSFNYNYNASAIACGDTVYFRVEAVSTNGTVSPPSDNTAMSQLNKFIYSTAPQNLTIVSSEWDETAQTVDMTISFTNPSPIGCGEGLYFNVYVNGDLQSTVISYNASASSYTWVFTDASFAQSGTVIVALVTKDTNPEHPVVHLVYPDKEGDLASAPYISTNIFLNPVDYQVYQDPASQDMILSWNDQTNGDWNQASYKLYYKYTHDSITDSPVLIGTYGTSIFDTTFDASFADCGDSFEFYIVCTLTDSVTFATKVITSNSQFVNIFKYSDAPQDLVINSCVLNEDDTVTMTFGFNKPDYTGCGEQLFFNVYVNNILEVTGVEGIEYDDSTSTYSYTFTDASFARCGTVEVALVTQDTNPVNPTASSLIFLPREGAHTSTPYIATNLLLEPVDYKVYTDSTQNMYLEWNSQAVASCGWSATYKVYYNINGDTDSSGNVSTGTSTYYTFDANTVACNSNIEFYVVATLVNGSTTFVVNSNTESINMFRYAEAPLVRVLWSSADIDNNIMDIRAAFTYPDQGCGDFVKFVANVKDESGVILATQNIVDTDPLQVVNFNDVSYNLFGAVEVYMVTTDTNSPYGPRNGDSGSGPFVTAALPIIRNVDLSTNSLTFNVITQSELDPVGWGLGWVGVDGSQNVITYNTDPGDNLFYTVVVENGVNSEHIYTFSVLPGLIGLSEFPTQMIILASNNVGMRPRPATSELPFP